MPSSLGMNDLKDDMNLKYSTMVYWLIDESILQYMVIKILFALLIFLFIFSLDFGSDNLQKDFSAFQQFRKKYGKSYPLGQVYYRQRIFRANHQHIKEHNAQRRNNFTLQINSFADLTLQQFKFAYLGLSVTKKPTSSQLPENPQNYQIQIDWQKEGKVTPVKNQQMCASCWAFCSIAALQSAYLILKGINISLSEQQLVDCSTSYGNKGCHGGQLQYTFRYMQQKGVNAQSSYPYTAKDQNCKKTHGPYKMSGYSHELTCGGLFSALLKGPVAVAVDAVLWGFYKEGIYDDCGNQVNHGVLVVAAYKDYWWVKNLWGVQWGDHGYIKLKRGNTCSICEYPYLPLL